MRTTPQTVTLETEFSREARQPEFELSEVSDAPLLWGLTALLLFGPLAFGAVEPWSISILQAGAVLLFLYWCLRQYFARELTVHVNTLFLPAAAFAIVVVAQIALRTTVFQYGSVVEAMNYFCYAILMFLAAQVLRSERQLKLFAAALATFGFLMALFAIIQSLTSNGLIYWFRQPRFTSPIYGSYVNRNHYAGLMEMLMPFALVLSFSRHFNDALRLLLGFSAVVMGASIVLSGSRGGATAFLAELVFLALISFVIQKRSGGMLWGIPLFFFLLVGFLFWIDIGSFLHRWTSITEDLETGRPAIARDCLRMFWNRPFLGWGLGSFPTIYPQFRSFYTDYFINQAHNDFLQVLVETGIAGALSMLWFVVAIYKISLQRLRDSRSDIRQAVRLAALTGCTGILIHSIVDFNLHIPANAVLFYVLCIVAASPRRLHGN
ncbi:MAG: O-antigen polymerase [Acidobacteriaceae bacterium]|nr:O-antigen polymerase [Acidobacteriaceae bacterium]